MTKIAFSALLASVMLSASLGAVAPAAAESIPSNCTLNPFTGKRECHIWPSCTLDPYTGKMNCPAPKAQRASRSSR